MQLTAQNNQGNGKFGVNVWWTIPEVVKDGDEVQQILERSGFEKTDIPLPSRRVEVSRACCSFQNRRGKENRRVTEKATEDDNFIVYGILDRVQRDSDKVGFSQTTTVRLDKANDSVNVEGALSSEVTAAIAEFTGKITDADVRAFLRRVIRMCYGVAKRPTGGIYFVPERFADIVRSAQAVLNGIGGGARIYIESVLNGAEERENVWVSVGDDVSTKINNVLGAVEKIEKRISALVDQKDKINEAKELMNFYVGLLGEEAKYQELVEKLNNAVKVIEDKMLAIQSKALANPVKTKKKVDPDLNGFSNELVKFAYEYLRDYGFSMKYRTLANKAIYYGLLPDSKNSPIRMYNTLMNSIKKGEGIFKKVDRGSFVAITNT